MHKLISELQDRGPVVTDGAWGTQLQSRGLPQGHSPDEWNLSHPDQVEEVAQAYVAAGSQVVLTNTFQANRLALTGHGLGDQTEAVNRAGVEISRRASDGRALVFASIGPTGKMLLAGETTEEELSSVYAEQVEALVSAGPDALIIETMSDLEEAKLALGAAKETTLPVIVSMVFDSGKDQDRTMMGVTPEKVVEELLASGADVIGANCGQGPATYVDICRRMRDTCELPIWIKPNAGLPRIDGDQVVYDTTPAEFADYGPALVQAGALFVGGCCGTTPEFIFAVKERIQS